MSSLDLSSSSDSSTDEDLQDCPVYKNLMEMKLNKGKQMDDPEFLAAECKKLGNKLDKLEKDKQKLGKDKKQTLSWSKELRRMSNDLEADSKELKSLRLEHEEVQNTITNLEEEILEMQHRREKIGMEMKRKATLMKNWSSQFAAVTSACRNVFATAECLCEAISEDEAQKEQVLQMKTKVPDETKRVKFNVAEEAPERRGSRVLSVEEKAVEKESVGINLTPFEVIYIQKHFPARIIRNLSGVGVIKAKEQGEIYCAILFHHENLDLVFPKEENRQELAEKLGSGYYVHVTVDPKQKGTNVRTLRMVGNTPDIRNFMQEVIGRIKAAGKGLFKPETYVPQLTQEQVILSWTNFKPAEVVHFEVPVCGFLDWSGNICLRNHYLRDHPGCYKCRNEHRRHHGEDCPYWKKGANEEHVYKAPKVLQK